MRGGGMRGGGGMQGGMRGGAGARGGARAGGRQGAGTGAGGAAVSQIPSTLEYGLRLVTDLSVR